MAGKRMGMHGVIKIGQEESVGKGPTLYERVAAVVRELSAGEAVKGRCLVVVQGTQEGEALMAPAMVEDR